MGLFKKIFKGDKAQAPSDPESSLFHESQPEPDSKDAERREMVIVVLHETVRQHGIPSDWIDCHLQSVFSRSNRPGLHVHLVVRKGHDRLLTYIPAFQTSFMAAIERVDARAADWLFSVSWQFDGLKGLRHKAMPDPGSWAATAAAAGTVAAAPGMPELDLISDFASTQDEDVESDLKALFAIRDAAIAGTLKPEPDPDDHGFQNTQPGPN